MTQNEHDCQEEDFGAILHEKAKTQLGYRPADFSETRWAWHNPLSGSWSGWFEAKDAAIAHASPGSTIVEKTITQRCVGIVDQALSD